MATRFSQPKFLKPGDGPGWEEDKSDLETTSATRFIYNANISLSYEQQRQRLPVFQNRNHILYLLEEYQTLVLVGDTGCGKSTQIPQYLLEAGWCDDGKIIGITEPRRVAVTTLASRVAEEKGSLLGQTVGYSIRFDDCYDPTLTKIKFMTEGILMREMMADPLLRSYSVIMLDEVHERTLFTDILMGLLKKILRKQRNLRLIIASATIDAEHLCNFFNHNSSKNKDKDTAVIMSVEGRLYPVEVFYLKEPVPDYVQGVVDTAVKIHEKEEPGGILCFLTGQDEVDRAVSLLKDTLADHRRTGLEVLVLPMYGSLPNSDQLKVFQTSPRDVRKIVVATNIAETSVTIPGIVYVVDCGFVKMRWYNPETYSDSLVIVPISQASAEQRAGRAGRVRPGKAYRLYTEKDGSLLKENTPPEMQRSELSSAVLQLKALGIDNVLRFSFPSPPPARSLVTAVELLHALGAIDSSGALTEPLGLQMAEFPLTPLHAKGLIKAAEFGCSEEMASILSLLQVQSVFVRITSGAAALKARVERRKFEVSEGDLLTMLNVYSAYREVVESEKSSKAWCNEHFVNHKAMKRVTEIRTHMLKLLEKLNVPVVSCHAFGDAGTVVLSWPACQSRNVECLNGLAVLGSHLRSPVRSCRYCHHHWTKGDTEKVCKSITAGFFPNAAYLHYSGVYKTVRGNMELHIHPTSVLYSLEQPQWILFCEIIETDRAYMRELTVIKPNWLEELAPHFYVKTFRSGD